MIKNPYQGVFEDWQVELIVARARRLGFRGHDVDDALQQVVLALLDFQYDSRHPSQATEATVLIAVIDRQLLAMRRAQRRYAKHVTPAAAPLSEDTQPVREPAAWLKSNIDLTDVPAALADLPEPMGTVAELLQQGLSMHQIAMQLRVSWHTVDRIVRDLQRRFQQLGLGTPRRRADKHNPAYKERRHVG